MNEQPQHGRRVPLGFAILLMGLAALTAGLAAGTHGFGLLGKKITNEPSLSAKRVPSREAKKTSLWDWDELQADPLFKQLLGQAVEKEIARRDSVAKAEAAARKKARQDSLAKVNLAKVPELEEEVSGLKNRLAKLEKKNKELRADLASLRSKQLASLTPVVVTPSRSESATTVEVKAADVSGQPASYIEDGYTYVQSEALRGVSPFYLIGPATNWKPDKRYEFKDAGNGYYAVNGIWREFQVIDSTSENWGDVGRFGNWVGEGKLDLNNPYKTRGVYMDPAKNHYIFKPVER